MTDPKSPRMLEVWEELTQTEGWKHLQAWADTTYQAGLLPAVEDTITSVTSPEEQLARLHGMIASKKAVAIVLGYPGSEINRLKAKANTRKSRRSQT